MGSLTDKQVQGAVKLGIPGRYNDGAGLHLLINSAGAQWRYRFEQNKTEKLVVLGRYPDMSLAQARAAREAAKDLARTGSDPAKFVRAQKQAAAAAETAKGETFEVLAREWYLLNEGQWTERHAKDVIGSLEKDVFPELGEMPIASITVPAVMAVLRKVEQRGKSGAVETAHRIRQRMSAVFVYAIASGRAENDPAATVKGAMAKVKKGRQPAIVDLDKAKEMLRKIETETAHPVTLLAVRILALTAVRPGALAETPWSEWNDLDKEKPVWRIPAARMKLKLQHKDDEARDFLVPLSRQALDAIEALRPLTGRGKFTFPNARHSHKPMSENAMGYLINRAGYHNKHVPHGFRATFSTVMNEKFPADRMIIDLMLAHSPKDKVEAAYHRAQQLHMERRRELAQAWADMIVGKDAPPAIDLLAGPRR